MPDAAPWDVQTDLLVVGSGAAALTAAVVAATHGARTLVVEKSELFGGTSATSGGVIWIPATQLALDGGHPDTARGGLPVRARALGRQRPRCAHLGLRARRARDGGLAYCAHRGAPACASVRGLPPGNAGRQTRLALARGAAAARERPRRRFRAAAAAAPGGAVPRPCQLDARGDRRAAVPHPRLVAGGAVDLRQLPARLPAALALAPRPPPDARQRAARAAETVPRPGGRRAVAARPAHRAGARGRPRHRRRHRARGPAAAGGRSTGRAAGGRRFRAQRRDAPRVPAQVTRAALERLAAEQHRRRHPRRHAPRRGDAQHGLRVVGHLDEPAGRGTRPTHGLRARAARGHHRQLPGASVT